MKGQKKSFMIKKESGTKFHKSFFMAMKHVPTSTAQEKKFNTKTGAVYLDERAAKAKKTLDDALSKFDKFIPVKFEFPSQKELNLARSLDTTVETKVHRGLQGAVKLKTIWCFPEKQPNQIRIISSSNSRMLWLVVDGLTKATNK